MNLMKAERQESLLEPTRKVRQLLIKKRWYHNKGVGTAQCVTGFGKTTLALLILYRYRKVEKQKSNKVIVVVPTTYLYDQWMNKLELWGLRDNNIEVWTIQSLVKRRHKCSFLIPDEIHCYTGEQFSTLFDVVEYEQMLGLTATLDENDSKTAIIRDKCPIIDTISLKEAVDNNWISDYTLYNLGFYLDDEQLKLYNKITKNIGKTFAYFNHDFGLMLGCITNKKTRESYASTLNLSPGQVFGLARQAKNNIKKRQDFLYNLPQKVNITEKLVNKLEGEYIITFSQSIDITNKIAEALPNICLPYHSKLKLENKNTNQLELLKLSNGRKSSSKTINNKKSKEIVIKRFLNKKDPVRVISSAKSLDMGVDIPQLDTGIITSGTSKFLQSIQRMGRILRYQENKIAKIVDIYCIGTQDETWLKRRQQGIPMNRIKWITSIDEIE